MTTTRASTVLADLPTTTARKVAALGTVLSIWAHPDDEAYLAAGLMATATDLGSRVVCVTATRGEHGTSDPERWPPERLAPIREREMAASLAVLGVSEHRWLPYADGACASVAPHEAMATIAAVIDEVRPDTIVTFGPDGMTGHPDHRAVSAWVTAAWSRSRDLSRARLLYATTTYTWAEQWRSTNERLGVFGADGPPRTADGELALALDLAPRTLDRKLAALRAQPSQTSGLIEQLGEAAYGAWWDRECFIEAPAR
jgi:LmbE family N-acetylglucosaminyl deacetylase